MRQFGLRDVKWVNTHVPHWDFNLVGTLAENQADNPSNICASSNIICATNESFFTIFPEILHTWREQCREIVASNLVLMPPPAPRSAVTARHILKFFFFFANRYCKYLSFLKSAFYCCPFAIKWIRNIFAMFKFFLCSFFDDLKRARAALWV